MATLGHVGQGQRGKARGWLVLLGRVLLPVGLFAIALFGAGVNAAHAAVPDRKIAADLKHVLSGNGANPKWVANTGRGTYVQVVIAAASTDPALTDLRAAILANGGSVYYAYQATPAVLAVLPADAVATIAARGDVLVVVPNRPAFRTASFLQEITGVRRARR